jgi:hypothetical protein
LSGSCARRFVRRSEYELESEGTFHDSRPPLQSHVDPSGKTTSISCERGGCAVAVVDTVVTVLVAVGVVVLPQAARPSAKALSAKRAKTGVKRRAFTLATVGLSIARRAGTGNPEPMSKACAQESSGHSLPVGSTSIERSTPRERRTESVRRWARPACGARPCKSHTPPNASSKRSPHKPPAG